MLNVHFPPHSNELYRFSVLPLNFKKEIFNLLMMLKKQENEK